MDKENRTLEDMDLPCPLDICDGDGWISGATLEDNDTMCPCNPKHPDNNGDQ